VFQQGRLLRLSAISPQNAAIAGLLLPGGGGKDLRPQLRGLRQGLEFVISLIATGRLFLYNIPIPPGNVQLGGRNDFEIFG